MLAIFLVLEIFGYIHTDTRTYMLFYILRKSYVVKNWCERRDVDLHRDYDVTTTVRGGGAGVHATLHSNSFRFRRGTTDCYNSTDCYKIKIVAPGSEFLVREVGGAGRCRLDQ